MGMSRLPLCFPPGPARGPAPPPSLPPDPQALPPWVWAAQAAGLVPMKFPSMAPTSQLGNPPPPRAQSEPRRARGPWLTCQRGPLPTAPGTGSLARSPSRTWGREAPQGSGKAGSPLVRQHWHGPWSPRGPSPKEQEGRADRPGQVGLGAVWALAQTHWPALFQPRGVPGGTGHLGQDVPGQV